MEIQIWKVGICHQDAAVSIQSLGIRIRDPNPHLKRGQKFQLPIICTLEEGIDILNAWKPSSSNSFVNIIQAQLCFNISNKTTPDSQIESVT